MAPIYHWSSAQVKACMKAQKRDGGGCYVATAVYGSYDCPPVWTLRRYRDYKLAKTWYGRAFIRAYYAISPVLVKCFGHNQWFKRFWKDKLDKMVAKLQTKGFDPTPYEDITRQKQLQAATLCDICKPDGR